MKNINIYLLLLIFFMVSCQKDYDIETYDLGAEFLISDNGLTSLDTDFTFTVDNISKNLSEVTLVDNGTIAITDGIGTKTLNADDQDLKNVDDSKSFKFDAMYDGKSLTRSSSITVENPLALTSPYVWEKNDDDEWVETPVTVYQNSDEQYIKYSVSPYRATVESIKIETKVGEEGTYTEVTGSFDPEMDSLLIVGDVYNTNDTVFYMFTAKSGTKEQTGSIEFVINTVMFPHDGGAQLNTTDLGFDLVSNEIVPVGTDTTDFEFVHVLLTSVGFESNNGAMFVATDEATYLGNDVVATKALFDAGSQQSGFASVSENDYYIYKTSGGTYGIIKITAVYLTTGGNGDYFEFEYIY